MKKVIVSIMVFALLVTLLPVYQAEAGGGGYYKVKTETVIVRDNATPKAKALGTLKKGNDVEVYGILPGGWAKIAYATGPEKAGYVSASSLSYVKPFPPKAPKDTSSEELFISTAITLYQVDKKWTVQVNNDLPYFLWVLGFAIPVFGDLIDAYIFSSHDFERYWSTAGKTFIGLVPQSAIIDAVILNKRIEKIKQYEGSHKFIIGIKKVYNEVESIGVQKGIETFTVTLLGGYNLSEALGKLINLYKVNQHMSGVMGDETKKIQTINILSRAFKPQYVKEGSNFIDIYSNQRLKMETVNGVKPPGEGRVVIENLTKDIYDYVNGKKPKYYPEYVAALTNYKSYEGYWTNGTDACKNGFNMKLDFDSANKNKNKAVASVSYMTGASKQSNCAYGVFDFLTPNDTDLDFKLTFNNNGIAVVRAYGGRTPTPLAFDVIFQLKGNNVYVNTKRVSPNLAGETFFEHNKTYILKRQ